MGRKKKQVIKVNNSISLEALMQETYSDACDQIYEAQKNITEMSTASEPEDVRDYTELAAQKTNALKIKDSAIKIKLDLAKLQSDILKHNGDVNKVLEPGISNTASTDDFKNIREMIKKANESKSEVVYKLDK